MPKYVKVFELPEIIGEGIDVIYFNVLAEVIKNCLMSFLIDVDLYGKVFMKWNI